MDPDMGKKAEWPTPFGILQEYTHGLLYTYSFKKKHTKHVIPWPPISAHPPLWLEKRRDVSRIVESLHLRIRDMAKIKLGSMDAVTAPLGATL